MESQRDPIEHRKQIFREYLGDSLDKINALMRERALDVDDILLLTRKDSSFFFAFSGKNVLHFRMRRWSDREGAKALSWLFSGLEDCFAGDRHPDTDGVDAACFVCFPHWRRIEMIVERRRLEAASEEMDRDPDSIGLFL